MPREWTGHSKHPLPTTQEKTLHIDITRWSIPKSLIIFFAAKDGEALCSQQKQEWELTVAQIMNSLSPPPIACSQAGSRPALPAVHRAHHTVLVKASSTSLSLEFLLLRLLSFFLLSHLSKKSHPQRPISWPLSIMSLSQLF